MSFAVYLTLVAGVLSPLQGEVRAPIAIEAGRFDQGVGALVTPDRLSIELARYTSDKSQTGSASGMDDLHAGPPPSPGEEPRLTAEPIGALLDAQLSALEVNVSPAQAAQLGGAQAGKDRRQ